VVLGLTLVLGVAARAQWQVVYLHPEGAKSSDVHAAAGTRQGGRIEVLDGYVYQYHPVIWNASGEEYTDLLPAWGRSGIVHGMDAPSQVGYVSSQWATHAALWCGSAESFVDLSPGGDYVAPIAYDVAGNEQVGYGYYAPDGYHHAALWHGSAKSFVDLHPGVARWSRALATDGVRQGGWASFPAAGELHAVLWEGSAESFIDMNPQGARESAILGMGAGVQVGRALFGTSHRAVLWRGSPEGFVDMQPSQGYSSRLYDTTGTIHVGYVSYTGWAEAGIWTGEDPDSFENLHPYLGPGWFFSAAHAVSVHDGWLYVAGSAARSGEREQAILWMRRLPRPQPKASLVLPEKVTPLP